MKPGDKRDFNGDVAHTVEQLPFKLPNRVQVPASLP